MLDDRDDEGPTFPITSLHATATDADGLRMDFALDGDALLTWSRNDGWRFAAEGGAPKPLDRKQWLHFGPAA